MIPLRRSPWSLLAMLALAPAALIAQQATVEPPAPAAIRTGTLPAVQETVLANGLKLVVLSLPRQPVLSVTLSLPAGSVFDPGTTRVPPICSPACSPAVRVRARRRRSPPPSSRWVAPSRPQPAPTG